MEGERGQRAVNSPDVSREERETRWTHEIHCKDHHSNPSAPTASSLRPEEEVTEETDEVTVRFQPSCKNNNQHFLVKPAGFTLLFSPAHSITAITTETNRTWTTIHFCKVRPRTFSRVINSFSISFI